jgi:DNA-binding GntR family transcriptional regulator
MARRSTPSLVTYASLVYDRLRHDILAGVLPPGQKLRIESICDRYEAGNSPVREALNRLSAEGLVERREQRGFYVAPISSADLDELVRTRCWLEELALRESIRLATNGWHESLVVLLHRLRTTPRSTSSETYRVNPEWELLHRNLHRALISACGSARLVHYCDDLADQAYRYRQLAVRKSYPDLRDVQAEHEEVVAAVLKGHSDLAVRLLMEHYGRTADIVRNAEHSEHLEAAA